jgi:hypothetical protein
MEWEFFITAWTLIGVILLMHTFTYEWRITYVIDGNMIWTFAKNMIARFLLADGTRRTETIRSDLLSEFEVRSALAIELF